MSTGRDISQGQRQRQRQRQLQAPCVRSGWTGPAIYRTKSSESSGCGVCVGEGTGSLAPWPADTGCYNCRNCRRVVDAKRQYESNQSFRPRFTGRLTNADHCLLHLAPSTPVPLRVGDISADVAVSHRSVGWRGFEEPPVVGALKSGHFLGRFVSSQCYCGLCSVRLRPHHQMWTVSLWSIVTLTVTPTLCPSMALGLTSSVCCNSCIFFLR